MTHADTFTRLVNDANHIKSDFNRWQVNRIIESAVRNANDTVEDRDAPPSDWSRLFVDTIAGILSSPLDSHGAPINHHVRNFFSRRGINY